MTTSTNQSRSLSELLDLGTYQGMTDEEIDMVLDHKVMLMVSDAEYAEKMATNAQTFAALVTSGEGTAARIADMIESMQGDATGKAQPSAPKLFTPQSMEV